MSRPITDFRLYAAIRRQPDELQRLLTAAEPVDLAAHALASVDRVYTVGIGTSWNAASLAAMQLRAAGLEAAAWSSHDLVAYPPALGGNTAVMLFTHTGAKRFSRRALELAGEHRSPLVLVTSTESAIGAGDLPIGATILRTTERETSAMFTVSHTAAMLLAARVADAVRPGAVGDLEGIPDAVAHALEREEEVAALAEEWFGRRVIVALGAGPHELSAREFAIKVAEAARRPVQGHALEQYLHGLQVPLSAADGVLLFAGPGPADERTRAAAHFALALDAGVAWVGPGAPAEVGSSIDIAAVDELLAPIVEAVPAQLLAGHLAALAGVDADAFRSDDAAFSAARAALGL